jgi:hypothetical protein
VADDQLLLRRDEKLARRNYGKPETDEVVRQCLPLYLARPNCILDNVCSGVLAVSNRRASRPIVAMLMYFI